MWAPEPTKPVPAEYPYLAGKKACVVVWAEPETLFEYPNVQLEISEFVGNALTRNVQGLTLTPNRQVAELQKKNRDWERVSPAKIGTHFGVERVIVIELAQYSMRDVENPHLLRGRINAAMKVYDTAYPDAGPSYKTSVDAAYPPDSPGKWGSDERGIRRGAMEAFAEAVSRKFFDHRVKAK